jgi:hypothetical protein
MATRDGSCRSLSLPSFKSGLDPCRRELGTIWKEGLKSIMERHLEAAPKDTATRPTTGYAMTEVGLFERAIVPPFDLI